MLRLYGLMLTFVFDIVFTSRIFVRFLNSVYISVFRALLFVYVCVYLILKVLRFLLVLYTYVFLKRKLNGYFGTNVINIGIVEWIQCLFEVGLVHILVKIWM